MIQIIIDNACHAGCWLAICHAPCHATLSFFLSCYLSYYLSCWLPCYLPGAHDPQSTLRHGPSRMRAQPEGAVPHGAHRHASSLTATTQHTTQPYTHYLLLLNLPHPPTEYTHYNTLHDIFLLHIYLNLLPIYHTHPLPPPSSLFLSPGTPIQNHVMDVWSVMQFLVPDYLGEKQQSTTTWHLALST